MRTFLFVAALGAITACNSSSSDAPRVSASTSAPAAAVAGHVLEVAGTVTVAGKPLAKGDAVAADAMIDTGADGSVTIELAHNLARWDLGPNKHVRVNESLAWSQPKRTEPVEQIDHDTASAGRPAERMAAGTTTTEGGDDKQNEAAPADPKKPAEPAKTANGKAAGGAKGEATSSDTIGGGGLGLTGTGPGGGGTGEGLGLGSIGTIGHGAGKGTGQGYGAGGGGTRGSSVPSLQHGKPTVAGSLPPEVIRRVVRHQQNRIRFCYEKGLLKNATLQGRVDVKFVIAKDGTVPTAQDAGSTIGDDTTVSCIVMVFKQMTFPTPDGGIVTVTYPMTFSPGK